MQVFRNGWMKDFRAAQGAQRDGCVFVPTDEGQGVRDFSARRIHPGGERSEQAYDIVNENDLQY
ncbi:hypothetical protein [Rhodanobacter sp. T12-5]|uniref:hypothetical protein n=1 Tax=Rhodanobacter sp. T12-5 TaxID=2024611 RepID=UPI0011EEBC6C|nr:hypothetical protein [Rhodanobacter sp. T12-5]KAA0070149.1 hypothetical protein CIW53_08665 [Rhodanobacter sp. T12-5]